MQTFKFVVYMLLLLVTFAPVVVLLALGAPFSCGSSPHEKLTVIYLVKSHFIESYWFI